MPGSLLYRAAVLPVDWVLTPEETITNRGLAHSDAGKLSYEAAVNL
jgi:hypothetical protein